MSPEPRQPTPREAVALASDDCQRAVRTFRAALRAANDSGMTWRELSALLDVPTPTLHRWARSRATPVPHEGDESTP